MVNPHNERGSSDLLGGVHPRCPHLWAQGHLKGSTVKLQGTDHTETRALPLQSIHKNELMVINS